MGNLLRTAVKKASRSRISVVGIAITGVLLPVLLLLMLLDLQGLISAPYFIFLLHLVIWPLCGLGILLIFVGLFFSRKDEEDIGLYALEYIQEQLSRPGRFVRVRKLIYLAITSTLLTVFILGITFYQGFQYTESVGFCGQFCHSVMEPQYVTYRNSPHSNVSCVQCHLDGEEQKLLRRSKLSGVRQLFATATDSYSRPILTPLSSLRPERGNCVGCHRPEKISGDRLHVRKKYLMDRDNTPVQTVMLMRVGSGGYQGHQARGIHWHTSEDHDVSYRHTDPERENIVEVILTGADGSRRVYSVSAEDDQKSDPAVPAVPTVIDRQAGEIRKMDCIDCHNRPAHIFLLPGEALDQKLLTNAIPRSLPFIKKQALEAITGRYETIEGALRGISQSLTSWYRENHPEQTAEEQALVAQAVRGAQQAYRENVFPGMNIGWGTYRSFLGHADGNGCFRCHGRLREESSGEILIADCHVCHVIIAEDQPELDCAVALQKGLEHLR